MYRSDFTNDCACRPKFYFVKVDVQACFDTIEQTKLLAILRDVLSEVHLSLLLGNNHAMRLTLIT